MRNEEEGPLLFLLDVLGTVRFCLVLLGLGIAYLIYGHTAGRAVGIGLIVVGVALAGPFVWRRFAKRS